MFSLILSFCQEAIEEINVEADFEVYIKPEEDSEMDHSGIESNDDVEGVEDPHRLIRWASVINDTVKKGIREKERERSVQIT